MPAMLCAGGSGVRATRDQVKAEKATDEYLDALYRTIVSLESLYRDEDAASGWSEFVASTYGCMAEAPIERGQRGELVVRDLLDTSP
jgi:hypothetical protein